MLPRQSVRGELNSRRTKSACVSTIPELSHVYNVCHYHMPDKSQKKTATSFDKVIRNGVFIPAYILGAFAISIVLTYFQWFRAELNFPLSKDPAVWGQFGDFVGGVLNPICAYMAFVWLVRSYALQKTELVETRSALERGQAAQMLQAKTAYAAARIETVNIHMSAQNARADLERETLLNLKNIKSSGVRAISREGVYYEVDALIESSAQSLRDIEALCIALTQRIIDIEAALDADWAIADQASRTSE